MRWRILSITLLAGLLAACGGGDYQEPNNGGNGGNGGNPPPPSSGPGFTLTYGPNPFSVARGQTGTLTITANISNTKVKKVQLALDYEASDIALSNKFPVIDGSGSVSVQVTVMSGSKPKPFVNLTGTGLDKDNRIAKVEVPPNQKIQWTLP